MKKLNKIPPFVVGQEIVCIKNHSRRLVVVGHEYIVKELKQCGCGEWMVYVGVANETGSVMCSDCGSTWPDWRAWVKHLLFAPKDQFKAISFTKVMEQELTSVN